MTGARSIPITLVTHLKQPATTQCMLLKIMPRVAPAFGITSLDRDVTYDDGTGPITYRAKRGYTPSDQVSSAQLSVDNGEAQGLLAEYAFDGMTAEGVRRGDYDGAAFVQYLVNYEDLTNGHVEINSGTTGQVRQVDNLGVVIELRSLIQQMKQDSIIELTSISCRARFGDSRCKKELVWQDATVTSVGAEIDRVFVASALPSGFKAPGIVQWQTGANAGRESEVEEYDSGTGRLTLMIPTHEPIAPGDTARIRRDCDKSKAMCRDDFDNLLNMRAEPELPRGNGIDLQAPKPPKGSS